MKISGFWQVARSTVLILVFLLVVPLHSHAAEEGVSPGTAVSPDVLAEKLGSLEESKSLGNELKGKLRDLYQRAQDNLEKAHSYDMEADGFSQAIKKAPAETEKLQQQLDSQKDVSASKSLEVTEKTAFTQLEQLLQQKRTDLIAAETKLSDVNKNLEIQGSRPADIRDRVVQITRRQDAVAAEMKTAPPSDEAPELTQARQWALAAEQQSLTAEARKLELEQLSHQVRVRLLEVKQAAAEQQVTLIESEVRYLEETLGKRLVKEAEKAQEETEVFKQELKSKNAVVRQLAERNASLGDKLTSNATDLEHVASLENDIRTSTKRVSDELSTIKQKIDIAGLNQALGQVLIEYRRTLPDLNDLMKKSNQNEQLIAATSLQLIQYSDEQRRLQDRGAYVAELTQTLSPEELSNVQIEINQLVYKRQELIAKVIASESTYLRALGELDLAYRQFIEVIKSYQAFLDKRLLWVRSTEPVNLSFFVQLPQEISQVLSPTGWATFSRDLGSHLIHKPGVSASLLIFIILAAMRKRFVRYVAESTNLVGHVRTDSFVLTLQSLLWTVLASAPVPFIVMLLGWRLSNSTNVAPFTQAVGDAFSYLAMDFLFLSFFVCLAMPGGVMGTHFRWSQKIVKKLRRELKLLMALFLPAGFIAILSIDLNRAGFGGGLAMLAILVAIGSIGLFVYRVFTPDGGILSDYVRSHPDSLFSRLRSVWLAVLLAYILGLLVLVLFGYMYTGGMLTRDLINTIWLFFFLALARGLVIRWLLLVQRRLALKALLAQRDEARATRKAAKEGAQHTGSEDKLAEIEEPEVDLVTLDIESRKLINTAMWMSGVVGFWLIWSSKLPAFSILEDISLWSQSSIVDGVEKLVPVTMADLALAVIVAIITITAARGIPAFVEFFLLQRTAVTAGGRYTATTLIRYLIVGVGIVLFFYLLGGRWSQIQWLVAALGVGIGFGLQEIVANFISGLIILFERPIRVGDVVTVGNTSGVVTRINIRATTITNWDRQELLVPNKEFITNQLLNWSLSDPITRVRIPVGIAYGSDVRRALELMQEAADEHENVLKDPAPILTFEAFGDNSLNLQLRAYLPSMENRLKTITELHEAINRKFNEAGIVVAFPQRDVHLDIGRPLDVRIHPGPDLSE